MLTTTDYSVEAPIYFVGYKTKFLLKSTQRGAGAEILVIHAIADCGVFSSRVFYELVKHERNDALGLEVTMSVNIRNSKQLTRCHVARVGAQGVFFRDTDVSIIVRGIFRWRV